MGDQRNVLDHGDAMDVLGDHLASVTMECDLGLVKGLEDVVAGLCGRHAVTAPTVSHDWH